MSKLAYLAVMKRLFANPNKSRKRQEAQLRRLDRDGDVMRLPPGSSEIRVQAGRAWVSAAGRDYVVGPGETLRLPVDRYPALVSPAPGQQVLMEVDRVAPSTRFRFWRSV